MAVATQGPTPAEWIPFLAKPVSSSTSTPPGAPSSQLSVFPPGWTAYTDTRVESTGPGNVVQFVPSTCSHSGSLEDPFVGDADTQVLKDYDSGATLPASVQLDVNVNVSSVNPTTDPFDAGDELDVFGGIVNGAGVYSFRGDLVGSRFDVNFAGLDDAKKYAVVVGSDRADGSSSNQFRWSQFQLTGAASFTQSATTTPDVYIVGDAGASVAFNTGNNSDGYVARWTGVTPVDGRSRW